MKQLFLAAAVLLAGAGASWAQSGPSPVDKPNGAEIRFDKDTHDFGTIPQGIPVTYEYIFKNVGKSPLVVTSATASCGCTTPVWSKEPIKPGQPGFVKATFNAASPGPFTKSVTVMSNAKNGQVVLYLKGEVKPAAQPK